MENALKPTGYERLTIKEMKNEVLSHFYFEKGIMFTLLGMLKNPERLINIYLYEDRRRAFNPFRYLLIAVAVSTLVLINHPGFQKFIEGIQSQSQANYVALEQQLNLPLWEMMLQVQEIWMSYQNIFIIISIPLVGWVTWLFFGKQKYNYPEHLVINAFAFGTTYWVSSIVGLLSYFSGNTIVNYIIMGVTLFLLVYFYKQIFKKNIFKSALGMFLAYLPVYVVGILAQIIMFIIMIFTW